MSGGTLTTRPVPLRERLDRATWLAAHRDAIAAVLSGVVLVVLAGLTWQAWGDLSHDTGYDWVAADRLASGELPYADFPYYYGPLGVALLSVVVAAFGSSVAVVTGFGLAVAAAAVALTFALARRVSTPAGALVAAALASCAALATANKGLVHPHTVSASVAVMTSLAALVAASRYAAGAGRRWLIVAGIAAGATALTRPEFAVAALIALGGWLGIRLAGTSGPDRRAALRDLRDCAALALGIPLLAYGLLAVVAGPADLSDSLLARDELRAGASDVLKSAAPLTASSFAELLASLAVYAAGAAALVAIGRALDGGPRARRVALAVGAVAAFGFLAVLVARPEALRSRLDLAYAWIPAGAVLAIWYLIRRRGAERAWDPADQAALLCSAFLAVLAAKTYAAFDPQPNPERAQSAIYALPFAGVFLAWLHCRALPAGRPGVRLAGLAWIAALALAGLVLTAQDGRDETGVVSGPGGSLAVPEGQEEPLQAVLDAVRASTRPGEPVLFAPQLSALYVLADRPNPLPQISLLPGALATPSEERAAIARMSDVRVVAVDRRARSEYGQGAFGVTYHRQLGDWLRQEFELTKTYRGVGDGAMTIDLWQRSAS
jgi:hypothetical protein